MTPWSAALRNLVRRPGRVVLAVAGVMIGVAVYAAMVTIGDGVERVVRQTSNLSGAELVLQQRGADFPELSWIDGDEVQAIVHTGGVASIAEVAIRITRFGPSRYLLVLGVGPEVPLLPGMSLTSGRLPAADHDEILLGREAAATLGVASGDTLRLQRRDLAVCGVFTSGSGLLNRGALLQLALHQRLFDIGDRRNLVFVHLTAGAVQSGVLRDFRRRLPELEAVPTDGLTAVYGQIDLVGEFARVLGMAAAFLTLLAVSNVMVASVADRLAEIALLRALGWRRRQVLTMVMVEGALVTVVGIATGLMLTAAALPLAASGDLHGVLHAGLAAGRCLEAAVVVAVAGLLGTIPAALYALRAREASLLRI